MSLIIRLAKALGGRRAAELFQRHQSENYLRFEIPYEEKRAKFSDVFLEGDAVRRGAMFLALRTLAEEDVPGALAEVGVYRGHTAALLHRHAPGRTCYLFDTFEGFDARDETASDTRFRDTSVEAVLAAMNANDKVIVRKGWFPETAAGLEDERFALVSLDADKYNPTLAGLEFFYPRLSPGGYIFLHDYNSPESERAVKRACSEFLSGKPEAPFEIPDLNGSLVVRKNRA